MRCMVPRAVKVQRDTSQAVLDIAQRYVQEKGFNAFSFADIATELDLTTASLHYHYPTKAALGEALVTRYASRFDVALGEIEGRKVRAKAKLKAYADVYLGVLRERRMCLCGMLAAEYDTLPRPMQTAVSDFLDRNYAWLTRVLEEGQRDGSL